MAASDDDVVTRAALRSLRQSALRAQRKRGDAGLMISIGLADPEREEDDEDEDEDEL